MIRKEISDLKMYCSDDISMIENYDKAIADKENIWHCHHRLEIGSNGERVSHKDLKRSGLYFNRPASELIFMLGSDHNKLHNKNPSEETRRKRSESCKGRQSPNKGKHLSAETKKKMSLSIKSYWAKKRLVNQ